MSERLKILNIWVDPVDREEAIRRIKKYLEKSTRPHSVIASNPEKNFSVPKDPVLHETFKNADLLIPDGIGMVLAARILYAASLERVPGAELIFDICSLAAKGNHGVFIYGSKESVNKVAAEEIERRYPGLKVAGRANGYVGEDDMPELIDRINASRAEILFLALGSPKQERWYAAHKGDLKYVKVVQGVGGSLDTIAGSVKRAPAVWRKMSIEWLYRLLSEPTRIKRQWVLPIFAAHVLNVKLKSILRRNREVVLR